MEDARRRREAEEARIAGEAAEGFASFVALGALGFGCHTAGVLICCRQKGCASISQLLHQVDGCLCCRLLAIVLLSIAARKIHPVAIHTQYDLDASLCKFTLLGPSIGKYVAP